MNLVKTLNKSINKQDCDSIVKYIGKEQDRFNELVTYFPHGSMPDQSTCCLASELFCQEAS